VKIKFSPSNAGGTNKSNYVVNALTAEMVRVRRLLSSDLVYLRVGHSKTSMDQTFANISTSIDGKDFFNHLYVTYISSQYLMKSLTSFSMLRDLIAMLGICCTIFWTPDFYHWKDSVKETYTKNIDNISTFGYFSAFSQSSVLLNRKTAEKHKYVHFSSFVLNLTFSIGYIS
jgi:hypothetical protein